MSPEKKKQIVIDQSLKEAFERNGVNTLLLDIRDAVTEVVTKVAHLEQRDVEARESRRIMHDKLDSNTAICSGLAVTVARIAPLVDQHEASVQQKIGQQKFIDRAGSMVTKTRATIAALITGGGGFLAWWFHWPAPK